MEITTIATGMPGSVHVRAFGVLGSPSALLRPRGGWRAIGHGKQARYVPAGVTVDDNWTGVSVPGRQLCRDRT
ncbi:hypothetical protein GCM10009836_23390 [Pseudonocardia ailaonensis]|uniref:Uncharacterized protein n=1 Tax=Pseudonocardia ailaonensis TaxID=367279 RepID=A0ABN2MZC6_9PSEU